MSREWRSYIDDMIGFAERVLVSTDGLDQERFAKGGMIYNATLRNLERSMVPQRELATVMVPILASNKNGNILRVSPCHLCN